MGINGALSMKKHTFLSILLLCGYSFSLTAMQLDDVDPSKRYVIGVDLHDTYLSLDLPAFTKEIAKIVAGASNKLTLVRLAPWIAMRGWALSKEPQYAGAGHDVMQKLADEFPVVAPIKEPILHAIDSTLHKPNPKMVKIMRELKAKGLPIIIVSNITERGLKGMKENNPDAFNVFDAEFISSEPREVKVGNEEIMVPKKPNENYYKILRNKLLDADSRFSNKTMIFVDDRQDYIDGAHRAGVSIEGVVYKNPEQYREVLVQKGLLQPRPAVEQSIGYLDMLWARISSAFA